MFFHCGHGVLNNLTFRRYHGISFQMLNYSAKSFQLLSADFHPKPNCKDFIRLVKFILMF